MRRNRLTSKIQCDIEEIVSSSVGLKVNHIASNELITVSEEITYLIHSQRVPVLFM